MKVSVVVPAYNEQELLPACLEALLSQSHAPDEIIVVDNNSADQTTEVARAYGVTVINEARQGIMPAVYSGMTTSKGDIIARCDADSIVPSDWVERIVEILQARPDAAGVTGPGRFYGTNAIRANLAQVWYMYAYFLLAGSALANWPLFGSNCAIRRTTWQEIRESLHRDHTDIHDDMEISMHIMPNQPIILKPSLVVGISSRSLRVGDMKRRYKCGWNTLAMHWPANSPWRRWRVRFGLVQSTNLAKK